MALYILLRLDMKFNLKKNHLLAPYTSWKIGGMADRFYMPKNLSELQKFLQELPNAEPITWLGAATNVLIRDGGIRGTVIYIKGKLNRIEDQADGLRVEAGVSCARLVRHALNANLDAAFLAGIPGTIGGALAMNAGAFGDVIWNHVVAVEVMNRHGEIQLKPAQDFIPSYRQVDGLNEKEWFVVGHLKFTSQKNDYIKERIKQFLHKRREKHPLQEPSCGSVFRNPSKDYAARLIEEAGLKGKRIGGTEVSEKHANFIINKNNALSCDMEALIQYVMAQVEKKSGIKLIPEVKILGENNE